MIEQTGEILVGWPGRVRWEEDAANGAPAFAQHASELVQVEADLRQIVIRDQLALGGGWQDGRCRGERCPDRFRILRVTGYKGHEARELSDSDAIHSAFKGIDGARSAEQPQLLVNLTL